MKFEWDQSYEIGNELIDTEHHLFIDLIKNVAYSVEGDTDSEYIVKLLMEVEKYAEFHFLSEENIMESCAYPDIERHRQGHRLLLDRLTDKIRQYERGEVEALDVLEFLVDWFTVHTVKEDRRIAEHIERLNIAGPI